MPTVRVRVWALCCLLAPWAEAQTIAIDHDAVSCVQADKFPQFFARFDPKDQVSRARLHFRPSGWPHWYSVPMKLEGYNFVGVLPKPERSLTKMEYYISVMDQSFGESRSEEHAPIVVSGPGACERGRILAAALARAKGVIVSGPEGAAGLPKVPVGFSGDGVIAGPSDSGGTTAQSGGASGVTATPTTNVAPPEVAHRVSSTTAETATAEAAVGVGEITTPASDSLAVAQGLAIDHQAVGCVIADKFPRYEALLTPSEMVGRARLHFRPVRGLHWYSVAMKPEGEGEAFEAILPQPKKSLKAFSYYIEVTGVDLGTSRTAEFTSTVASGPGACKEKVIATTVVSATVAVVSPAGAPLVPAGFASASVVAASGTTGAAAGASAAAEGGGISGKTLAIVGGVAGAGAAVAAVALGGETPTPGIRDITFLGSSPEPGSSVSLSRGFTVQVAVQFDQAVPNAHMNVFDVHNGGIECICGGGDPDKAFALPAGQVVNRTVALDFYPCVNASQYHCPAIPYVSSALRALLVDGSKPPGSSAVLLDRTFNVSYTFTP